MTQFYFSAVLAAITPVLTPSLGGFLTPLSAPVMTITSATVQVCDVVVMHSIPTPVVFEDLLISQEFKTCMFLLELQSYYLIDIIEEITVTGLCVCVCRRKCSVLQICRFCFHPLHNPCCGSVS
jgi:hypothetical protein